ncbi:zf-HC2 domain-containing protein [Corynebacterium pseudopelargi]|uniref:Putative zinc-finger domain-containing protein n=1 Tax=Corynebacterium pseudopelargi TaxID=2080757 RepID=A0A3G6IVC5_9CORY|nr:zf-HC2 domain-containing protein [Corynebacterium pseudopelargi]AZA09662.1 hypothetical protein CPPEL_07770 [Corynebacterium pseudopelargi]
MGYSAVLSCEQVKAALSARLDGEDPGISEDVLDAHVDACEQCRAFYEQAAVLNRQLAFHQAQPQAPDLSAAILDGVESTFQQEAARRAAGSALARVAMVLVACAWIIWAVVVLLRPSSNLIAADPYEQQLVIEAVSLRCALAFGLVFTAWQPRFIPGLLPVVGGLWMFTFGMSMRDLLTGAIGGSMVMQLVLLFASLLSMAVAWLSEKGWVLIKETLASLSATPRSER